MKYQYLLFDLDGTLIDTTEGVYKSAQHALKQFNINVNLEDLKPIFGPPLKYSFLNLFSLSDEDASKAVEIYLERYQVHGVNESRVFDEVPKLLADLKDAGYRMGVATSKYEAHAISALEHYNIAHYFDYITGANINETISKKHEVIEESLKRFNITNNRKSALMIGDMKYDIEGAKIAGIDSFGIYTGTASLLEHEKAGATYIAHSFNELSQKLLDEFYLE
ncbi:MAG: HAD hydrolase-like protein [Clostridia bacterium]|nr:HAD hydrolase-like protein [Clostridia bacterium]